MTDDLRTRAINSLKVKNHFWQILISWVVLSLFFVAIWLLDGSVDKYFWPIWPIAGIGIGVVIAAFNAFGNRSGGPSEGQIDAEMKRLGD